jgi:hypothetical protein
VPCENLGLPFQSIRGCVFFVHRWPLGAMWPEAFGSPNVLEFGSAVESPGCRLVDTPRGAFVFDGKVVSGPLND